MVRQRLLVVSKIEAEDIDGQPAIEISLKDKSDKTFWCYFKIPLTPETEYPKLGENWVLTRESV